jgi:hypothetical protein
MSTVLYTRAYQLFCLLQFIQFVVIGLLLSILYIPIIPAETAFQQQRMELFELRQMMSHILRDVITVPAINNSRNGQIKKRDEK